jgi:hypothetical protein
MKRDAKIPVVPAKLILRLHRSTGAPIVECGQFIESLAEVVREEAIMQFERGKRHFGPPCRWFAVDLKVLPIKIARQLLLYFRCAANLKSLAANI